MAEFDKIFEQVKNGPSGSRRPVGTLNYITPEKVVEAAK